MQKNRKVLIVSSLSVLMIFCTLLTACGQKKTENLSEDTTTQSGNIEITEDVTSPIEENGEQPTDHQILVEEPVLEEDSEWNMTEKEKQASYEEFAAQRISCYDRLAKGELYCLNRCRWLPPDGRIMADDPEQKIIPLEGNITVYGLKNDIFIAVYDDTEMVFHEYDGTRHHLCDLDEKVIKILPAEEYAFYQTESGKVYRIHYLSQKVDYVTDIQGGIISFIYDSMSILYLTSSEYLCNDYAYYDMEAGSVLPLPERYDDIFLDYSNAEIAEIAADCVAFDASRTRFVPDEGRGQINGYSLDEDGNLWTWNLAEGEESATIIEKNVNELYQWNEYVYFATDKAIFYRMNGISARAICHDLQDLQKPAGPIEFVGNDQYIFYLYENWILRFVPSLDYFANGVKVTDGCHNLRVYDNLSFLYDDAEGNTHYYDMETKSEQPIPEDWVEY